MHAKRVLIVSRYPLFDQSLESALRRQPDLVVVAVSRDLEALPRLVQTLRPDVVLAITGPEGIGADAFRLFVEAAACLIRISPDDGTMQVYQRRQVDRATLDDLLRVIKTGSQPWRNE